MLKLKSLGQYLSLRLIYIIRRPANTRATIFGSETIDISTRFIRTLSSAAPDAG